jgi:YD repeat-containing protein
MRRCFHLLWMPLLLSQVGYAQSVQQSYDALGSVAGVVDQNGNAAQYSYDAVGNILSISRYTANQEAIPGKDRNYWRCGRQRWPGRR